MRGTMKSTRLRLPARGAEWVAVMHGTYPIPQRGRGPLLPRGPGPAQRKVAFTSRLCGKSRRRGLRPNEQRPEPERWEYICVTVQDSGWGDPGAIEEAQYAVAGDEVLIADLDARMMGASARAGR